MGKTKIVSLVVAFLLGIFGLSLVPTATHAVSSVCDQDTASVEVKKANGCPGSGDSADVPTVIAGVIEGVVGVLALVAVIFIVVGGVNYMTSQGDPGKTAKAKNTILYAAIGLIIAVLAFAIVNFVIVNVLKNNTDGTGGGESSETTETTN